MERLDAGPLNSIAQENSRDLLFLESRASVTVSAVLLPEDRSLSSSIRAKPHDINFFWFWMHHTSEPCHSKLAILLDQSFDFTCSSKFSGRANSSNCATLEMECINFIQVQGRHEVYAVGHDE